MFGKEQGSCLDDWSGNCFLGICAVPLNGGEPCDAAAVASSAPTAWSGTGLCCPFPVLGWSSAPGLLLSHCGFKPYACL